jgi:hypothetical protein
MEVCMISFTVEEAAKSFEEKFNANGFTRSVLPNNADDYTDEIEDRDTDAVHDFIASGAVEYIAKLK